MIKRPGDRVTLEISAKSQPGKGPAALKWEVIFPSQKLDVDGRAEAGLAAAHAEKSLECKTRNQYSLNCTLSGGPKPIEDGTIAILHFKVRTEAEAGEAVFRIVMAEGTYLDPKPVPLHDTNAEVFIRR